MKLHPTGRADLLRALSSEDPSVLAYVTRQLGFVKKEEEQKPGPISSSVKAAPEAIAPEVLEEAPVVYQAAPVLFWRLEQFQSLTVGESIPEPVEEPRHEKQQPSSLPSAHPFVPLSSERQILTRLRKQSMSYRMSREIHVRAVVDRISRAEPLSELPLCSRRSWGSELYLVEDRSFRLMPYWQDQQYILNCLRKLYPAHALTIARLREGSSAPVIRCPRDLYGRAMAPRCHSPVLVLSDLGCLADSSEWLVEQWLNWGEALAANGNPAVALAPVRTSQIDPRLLDYWEVIGWGALEKALEDVEDSDSVLSQLLALVAPAIRLEPQLLRAIRRMIPQGRSDPGLEGQIWQSSLIEEQHPVAATLDQDQRRKYLMAFQGQEPYLRQAVFQLILQWHECLPKMIGAEEVLGLFPFRRDFSEIYDWESALLFLEELAAEKLKEPPTESEAIAIYEMLERLPKEMGKEHRVKKVLNTLFGIILPLMSHRRAYAWVEPELQPRSAGVERAIEIRQLGDQLQFQMLTGGGQKPFLEGAPGSYLGTVRTANGFIKLEPWTVDDFWQAGEPPPWAQDYGEDTYGLWASFVVGEVEVRMRWIPPGRFWMGSAETPEVEWVKETPRHEVEISQGFWLFETPCVQELWETVMGSNPSHFKTRRHPVEQVSWNDSQQFIERLNERVPGLSFRLPTEAEWEYACRSGTEGERYDEDLDAIAWYEDNSKGRAHPVGLKKPNGWGLHDMLGNVWEWCLDGARDYENKRGLDCIGPTSPDAARVLRGGAWINNPANMRSASRFEGSRVSRDHLVGFRLWASELPRQQFRGDPADANLGSNLKSISIPNWQRCEVYGARLVPETAEVPERPSWASGMAQDQYGFWASFRIGDVEQRLRWIRPGSFQMGTVKVADLEWVKETPRHEVEISRGFWMFEAPCTQELWEAVMGSNPSYFLRGKQHPVEQVSWKDCQDFIQRLNEQLPGLNLSLPTEAQWEYACRAGTEEARYHEVLDAIAWYRNNSGAQTHAVKLKLPNAWGLYDILGNVAEWCLDGARDYGVEGAVDPTGPIEGEVPRMIRGGSWVNRAENVIATSRHPLSPGYRNDSIGLRCISLGLKESTQSTEANGFEQTASGSELLDLQDDMELRIGMLSSSRFQVLTDRQCLRFAQIEKPLWATEMRRDPYGLWASFAVEAIETRMRWIPPGRFWMGSPEEEEGRYENEGSRHEVVISQGFWLFETPCTQELWQAVMGSNPSRSVSPDRPVEQVSWEDCQDFVEKLNQILPGVSLPTEAQWEYACRAGTETATYAGDLEILGARNAPVLDEIAWYGGNCGREYELGTGYDISVWSEMQYEGSSGGTHRVGLKKPNHWGLYDMLGNVWEWCLDGMREDAAERVKDPVASLEAEALRVIRGGSWYSHASLVRAAYRRGSHREDRDGNLGFRCLIQQ